MDTGWEMYVCYGQGARCRACVYLCVCVCVALMTSDDDDMI